MFVPLQRNLNDPQTKTEVGLLEEMSCNQRFRNVISSFDVSFQLSERQRRKTTFTSSRLGWRQRSLKKNDILKHHRVELQSDCTARDSRWIDVNSLGVFDTSAKLDKAVLFSCESRKEKWTKVWCRRENSLWFRLIKGGIMFRLPVYIQINSVQIRRNSSESSFTLLQLNTNISNRPLCFFCV